MFSYKLECTLKNVRLVNHGETISLKMPQRRLSEKSEASEGIGEGDGTLLQYSCLENPMDGGAW